MAVAAMLAGTVHQLLDLALGKIAPFNCQVYDGWCAFLGCRFHADKPCLEPHTVQLGSFIAQSNFLNLMGGIVLEPDQHDGQSRARRQLFGWCLMGVRCDPRGGGTFQFQTFILAPSPEIWSETMSGSEKGPGGEVGWPVFGLPPWKKISAA